MSLVSAVAIVAEGTEASHESGHVSPYLFGGIALTVLLLLLYAVTRINPDR